MGSSPDGGFYTVTTTQDFEWNETTRLTRWLSTGSAAWTRDLGATTVQALAATPDAGVVILWGASGFASRERFGANGSAVWAQFEGNHEGASRQVDHSRLAVSPLGLIAESFVADSAELFGAAFVIVTDDSSTDIPDGCFHFEARTPATAPLAARATALPVTAQADPGTATVDPPSFPITSTVSLAKRRQRPSCLGFFCDFDYDFIQLRCDNCPADANNDQIDSDADGRGDACDAGWVPMPSPRGSSVPLRVSNSGGILHVTWESVVATGYALYRGSIAALAVGVLDHGAFAACDLSIPEVYLASEAGIRRELAWRRLVRQ